jgi:hypothetical protein
LRAFRAWLRKSGFSAFRPGHAHTACEPSLVRIKHDLLGVFKEARARQKLVQQHSGDWTMTGKVPVARDGGEPPLPVPTGRMKAIPHIETMAGSPGADRQARSASRNLAHGFYVPDCLS